MSEANNIMTQKVLKVGSSAAVKIPKKSLEELGLKIGDRISVDIDKKHRVVSIKPVNKSNKIADQEILNWTKKFIERYRPALEALAKK